MSTRIAARKISLIPKPGCEEIPFTVHSIPQPKTTVGFLTLCLETYEQDYRGNLMVIEYDPQDLLTGDRAEEAQSVMEELAKQANKMFHEQVYGRDSVQRQNFDCIPQIKVKNQFISRNDQVIRQKLVFTIQTEYRHEVNFDEIVDNIYPDGVYFMPPHYRVE